MIRFYWCKEYTNTNGEMPKDYVVLDKDIWKNARKYFRENKTPIEEVGVLPVYDKGFNFVCFVWNDDSMANKEIRMLRELEELEDDIDFRNLNSDVDGVTIHGCNELAWRFVNYLKKRNIPVNVDGDIWEQLGEYEQYNIPYGRNYEIWAEGTWQKSNDLLHERIRTVSVEFECVDKIYEANIKAGKITDAKGDYKDLIERLRNEKEIVICDTLYDKALNVYDWLKSNGIDICAFLSTEAERRKMSRTQLFGKPIIDRSELDNRFKDAVLIDCASKYSAWGFGDVDIYDYEGYRRNERYICIRDYVEVPNNNLVNLVASKTVVLTGDIDLCNITARWYRNAGVNVENIVYFDLMNEENSYDSRIPVINNLDINTEYICMVVLPQYPDKVYITKETANRYGDYIEKLKGYDYTDYFSYKEHFLCLENCELKYTIKDLRPMGILLGAIPGFSGNVLVRQILEGHPQILEIDEYGYFNDSLYYICIRLAEKKSSEIIKAFWKMFGREADKEHIVKTQFPNRDLFDQKMNELLNSKDSFTSQELFVIFHIAYETMHGRKLEKLENTIIYWEPHGGKRYVTRDFAKWLGDSSVNGFTIYLSRNRYANAGSQFRYKRGGWLGDSKRMNMVNYQKKKYYDNWQEFTIRFEDIKLKPKETLAGLCEMLGIEFDGAILETTQHGKISYYENSVTGFDVKPAYNIYDEYFSEFDRLRICMFAGSYQKQNGYPYVNVLEFTRREIQEMILKDFRWELPEDNEKNIVSIYNRVCSYMKSIWREQFANAMNVELEEELM
jgi:hypothetical protein